MSPAPATPPAHTGTGLPELAPRERETLRRIRAKLGIHSTAELTRTAIALGLRARAHAR
ncbi:hypothetical protein OH779_03165 [Actinacidiphila glaucinigra]|uniref:hypothetical protein n=1 Tax=Actinacidiphila glaucinigra TaxID=235986 RepID=UPI003865EA7A